VPASTMRSPVGPEPRSNAEPTALGCVAAETGFDRARREGLVLSTYAKALRSCLRACLSALRACLAALLVGPETAGVVELGPVVEAALLGLPECFPVGAGCRWVGDFPPPPLGRHSL
jgi:hypothetical protein